MQRYDRPKATRGLRHPNVMSEAERLALPDPCRPLTEPVIPTGNTLHDLLHDASPTTKPQLTKPQLTNPNLSNDMANNVANNVANHVTNHGFHQVDIAAQLQSDQLQFKLLSDTSFDIEQFIHGQQRDSQNQPPKFRLPLSLLPTLVKAASASWWGQLMHKHPELAALLGFPHAQSSAAKLSELEMRLYVMGQMYHTMLCVFLLCQCKSRRTLNQQLTLQQLTDAINHYINAHRTELDFLIPHGDLFIEPQHVQFAVAALGWHTSKHADIAQRHTNISSQNPLTGL